MKYNHGCDLTNSTLDQIVRSEKRSLEILWFRWDHASYPLQISWAWVPLSWPCRTCNERSDAGLVCPSISIIPCHVIIPPILHIHSPIIQWIANRPIEVRSCLRISSHLKCISYFGCRVTVLVYIYGYDCGGTGRGPIRLLPHERQSRRRLVCQRQNYCRRFPLVDRRLGDARVTAEPRSCTRDFKSGGSLRGDSKWNIRHRTIY